MHPSDAQSYAAATQAYRRLRGLYGIPERVIKELVYALRDANMDMHPADIYDVGDWEIWYLLDRYIVLLALIDDIQERTCEYVNEANGIYLAFVAATGYVPPQRGIGNGTAGCG